MGNTNVAQARQSPQRINSISNSANGSDQLTEGVRLVWRAHWAREGGRLRVWIADVEEEDEEEENARQWCAVINWEEGETTKMAKRSIQIREMEKQAEVHSESVEDRKGFEKKMKVDGWKWGFEFWGKMGSHSMVEMVASGSGDRRRRCGTIILYNSRQLMMQLLCR